MDKAYKSLTTRIFKATTIVMVGALTVALIAIGTISALNISFFSVHGVSMEPTLHHRDSLILKESKKPVRDELAFFHMPASWTYGTLHSGEGKVLVKRILARGGDTLAYNKGVFTVNGEEIYHTTEEGYECSKGKDGYSHKLDKAELFMAGDNALQSLDSRRVFCDGQRDFLVNTGSVIASGTVAFKF